MGLLYDVPTDFWVFKLRSEAFVTIAKIRLVRQSSVEF